MTQVLLVLLVVIFSAHGKDSQTDTADNKLSLGPPPIHIDPQLRRALLQALTRLEQESQEQAAQQQQLFDLQQEEAPSGDAQFQEDYPFPEDGKENQDFDFPNKDLETSHSASQDLSEEDEGKEVVDERPNVTAPQTVNVINSENPEASNSSATKVARDPTTTSLLSQEESRNLANSLDNQITTAQTKIVKDTPSKTEKSISLPVPTPFSKSTENPPEIFKSNSLPSFIDTTDTTDDKKSNSSDKEVSIFQAPLVAAFTLHHDEHGLPHSVVPLFRPKPTATTPTSDNNFPPLANERELEDRTIRFQQQLLQVQQRQNEQLKQQQLLKETQERLIQEKLYQEELQRLRHEQLQRIRQQQIYDEQQRQLQQQRLQFLQEEKIRQLQLQQQRLQQQHLQQRLQRQNLQKQHSQQQHSQQSQFFPIEEQRSRVRPQRHEQGTGIVDFQKSVDVSFRPRPEIDTIPSVSTFQPHQHQHRPPFNTFHTHFQHNRPTFSITHSPPQQYRTAVDQVPSVSTNFHNINTFHKPPTIDSQLRSLLYESGVAGELHSNIRNGATPHEDLNIVSKVLLLNHEGRGNNRSGGAGVKVSHNIRGQ